MYKHIELVIKATAVASIKLSVESIAESYISVYNLHNTKLRAISEKTAEDEIIIHFNGPLLGKADKTLKAALDKHFNGQPWHFTLQNNIFRTSGITSSNILSQKVNYPFINEIYN